MDWSNLFLSIACTFLGITSILTTKTLAHMHRTQLHILEELRKKPDAHNVFITNP